MLEFECNLSHPNMELILKLIVNDSNVLLDEKNIIGARGKETAKICQALLGLLIIKREKNYHSRESIKDCLNILQNHLHSDIQALEDLIYFIIDKKGIFDISRC